MPKIPQLQRMYIKPAVDYAAGSTENVIAQALATTSQIALKFNNIQDATESQKAIADAKNSFYKFEEEAKIKYADDPDTFETEINNYKNTLLNATVNNTKVSRFNKSKFESTLNNSFSNVDKQIFDNKRKLQVQKFNSDINSALANNNNASYINGKNNNFETFTNDLATQLNNVAIIGREIMSPNELNVKLGEVRRQGTQNYLDGLRRIDPMASLYKLENGSFNNLLTAEEVDLEKDKVNKVLIELTKNKDIKKTEQQKINDANILIDLDTQFNDFNIKENKINNENLNTVEDIIDFRNKIKEAKANNNITNEQYKKFLVNTNEVLNNMMGENSNLKDGNRWFSKTVGEQINNKINTFIKENPEAYINDRVFFYENAFNILRDNGISMNSTDLNSIDKVNTTMEILKQQYINDKFDILKEKTNALMFGNNIISNDKTAGTVGKNTLNNGGYIRMKDKNGNQAMVLKDKSGKIIDIKKIN